MRKRTFVFYGADGAFVSRVISTTAQGDLSEWVASNTPAGCQAIEWPREFDLAARRGVNVHVVKEALRGDVAAIERVTGRGRAVAERHAERQRSRPSSAPSAPVLPAPAEPPAE